MYLLRYKNAITFCLCKRSATQQKTKLFLDKKRKDLLRVKQFIGVSPAEPGF
jgi:hypothetical protein